MATLIDRLNNNENEIPQLSKSEKTRSLNDLSSKTYNETTELLNTYGKAMIVRPTGFGKTRMLVKLAKDYYRKNKNKRVLYVYPINIIKTEICGKDEYMHDGIINDHVDFISYQELTLKQHKYGAKYWFNEINSKYSLIILDEVHRAGSDGFAEVYDSIYSLINKDGIHMVGATATPNRMYDTDEDNIINNIFDNHTVTELSLLDLIAIGVMPRPLYASSVYNIDDICELFKDKVNKRAKYKDDPLTKSGVQMILSNNLYDIVGAEQFIIDTLENAEYNLRKENYFKFIVFFTDISDVHDRAPVVERWFNDAFNVILKERYGLRSRYTINSHILTSSDLDGEMKKLADEEENRRYIKDTDKLNEISKENRTVDLIMTVNMVNMGYHVKDITGIVMLRGTKSEIVYYQQIGRCLSVKSNKTPVIFDFVLNYTEGYNEDSCTKNIFGDKLHSGVYGYNFGGGKELKAKDLILQYSNMNGVEKIAQLSNEAYPDIAAKVIWMYNVKKAPLCVISSETGMPISVMKAVLDKYGFKIREEDSMIDFVEQYGSKNATEAEKNDKIKGRRIKRIDRLLPLVYSRRLIDKLKDQGKLAESVIYKLFNCK